jgi:hypothetical protein
MSQFTEKTGETFRIFIIENYLSKIINVLSDKSLIPLNRIGILGDFLYDSSDEIDHALGDAIQNLIVFNKSNEKVDDSYQKYLKNINFVENKLKERGYRSGYLSYINAPNPPIDSQEWNPGNGTKLQFYKLGIIQNNSWENLSSNHKFLSLTDVKDLNYIRLYILDYLKNYFGSK